jgi:peptide/nickel transport system permease protein
MTVAGLQVGYLFGSIIVVETLFNYTGMGWLTNPRSSFAVLV